MSTRNEDNHDHNYTDQSTFVIGIVNQSSYNINMSAMENKVTMYTHQSGVSASKDNMTNKIHANICNNKGLVVGTLQGSCFVFALNSL